MISALQFFEKNMLYCFVSEDLRAQGYDPFSVQASYARHLDSLCLINLVKQTATAPDGKEVEMANRKVLLRCTTDSFSPGVSFLESRGAVVLETERDKERIEDWPLLGLTARSVWAVEPDGLPEHQLVQQNPGAKVFLKSRQKGFSAVIAAERLLHRDPELQAFLEMQQSNYGREMLLSEYLLIKADSLGTRESRHFVFGHRLMNSSRFVHSVRHTVPKSHIGRASEIVEQLRAQGAFPENYVLDLGEFVGTNGEVILDLMEINPVSCSLCYVNNSVFAEETSELATFRERWLYGAEYCFDALIHPERYTCERKSGCNYTYQHNDRYYFE